MFRRTEPALVPRWESAHAMMNHLLRELACQQQCHPRGGDRPKVNGDTPPCAPTLSGARSTAMRRVRMHITLLSTDPCPRLPPTRFECRCCTME